MSSPRLLPVRIYIHDGYILFRLSLLVYGRYPGESHDGYNQYIFVKLMLQIAIINTLQLVSVELVPNSLVDRQRD